MDRQDVFKVLDLGRDYQDNKWGGQEHDSQHSIGDFILFMERHLSLAKDCVYNGNSYNALNRHNALKHIRSVTGLGVACFEIFGVPEREIV